MLPLWSQFACSDRAVRYLTTHMRDVSRTPSFTLISLRCTQHHVTTHRTTVLNKQQVMIGPLARSFLHDNNVCVCVCLPAKDLR
jgi:hypothetical protein